MFITVITSDKYSTAYRIWADVDEYGRVCSYTYLGEIKMESAENMRLREVKRLAKVKRECARNKEKRSRRILKFLMPKQ